MEIITVMSAVRARILDGFDDPALPPELWEQLLRAGDTDVVYLTRQWQRCWWETLGRGKLLLVAGERNDRIVALAPLYADSGMVFVVGSGASDYLDVVGNTSDLEILQAILETAREHVPDFVGFRFYAVPESSRTGKGLQETAPRLGLQCFEEGTWAAPVIDLAGRPEQALAAANKKRLRKRENFFRQRGELELRQFRDGAAILPHLEPFFQQHISRWEGTVTPSPFVNQAQRALLECWTRVAAHTGWLRFTRLDWEGRPIAFELGCCYRGKYFGGPSSFAPDLAQRSPGQVLLRQLLLAAIAEGVDTYDLGVGEYPWKFRFATHVNYVRTWGLYRADVSN
ncbi:MAG: GNAT family N-acetyltransferase [Acidobacteria bacterium]|nr:GNAT family N-acetyltransferase [Acidobacteriota bacterium]